MKKILTCGFFLASLIALPVFAADFYVDGDNGNDITGTGESTAPYKSITQAVSAMAGGDTVYCKGTVTDGTITLTNTVSGTADDYTTITAWPGYAPIIDATGNASAFILGQVSYLKISNLNITGAANYGIYSAGGVLSEYIEISENNIYGLQAGALVLPIFLTDNNYVTIEGNEIYGDGDDNYGIGLETTTNVVIEKNKIHDFVRLGIASDEDCSILTIKNNLIYNISGDPGYTWNSGIVLSETSFAEINNNTIYNTYSDAVNISGIMILTLGGTPGYNTTVKNNIIHTSNYGVMVTDDSRTGFSSDYNDFYNVTMIGYWNSFNQSTLTEWQDASNADDHSIIVDPLLTSTTAGAEDFHLRATSPCIDAGQDNSVVTDDYDSEPRPFVYTDIGADERPVISSTPSALAAVPQIKKADLSWAMNGAYGVTEYNIKIGTLEDLSDATITNITTTTNETALTGLKPAETYYYTVQAVYSTDYQEYLSDYSDIANFITYPKKVGYVKVPVSTRGSTSVTAKWRKQNRVTGYAIRLMDKKGRLIRYIDVNTNKKKKEITGLTPGKKYKIQVRSELKDGYNIYVSKWSKIKSFKTKN
ncbi:MAG: right-handed parallel beta-helix repeat-containing protein [Patescibacteria group bacterium]|jgi:hypothetical protein